MTEGALRRLGHRELGEDYSRREFPVGIERAFDGAHLVNPFVAVQVAQQRLLHRVAADAVFGERAAAEARHLAAEMARRATSS